MSDPVEEITRDIVSVDLRHIDSLIPYARNARTHPPEQIAKLAGAIVEFGFTNSILADDQGIIAGHGRVLAARQLYDAGKIIHTPAGVALPIGYLPVVDCSGWSDAKRRAYILWDNQSALLSGWDNDLVKLELQDLGEAGYDLEFTGFSQEEIDSFLAGMPPLGTDGLTDPDETSEPPSDPISRPGDVWLLGRHRITCGDSTVATDVERVLAGATPHLMVTDPPYGVKYDPNWRNEADRANGKPYGASAVGLVSNDDRADWREAYALFPGDVAYVWHPPGARQVEFFESLVASGFDVRMQIIWNKSNFAIGRGDYHVKHEPCWYAVKKGATGHWQGDRTQSTVWDIPKPHKSETGHSTQKPVECMKRPIENNSAPGDAVYEPFSGSGTTIIACEQTGRTAYAIELNPAYVDVAVTRWEKFTGQTATLEGDGRTFAQVLAERGEPGQIQAVAL